MSKGPKDVAQWAALIDLITTTTKTSFPSSPQPPSPSFSEQAFQTYWRTVFSRLATSIHSDRTIPFFIASPPITKFTMTLFRDRSPMGCPCSLPDVSPNIVVVNEAGVNKDDVVRAFAEHMYGDTPPSIFYEPEFGSDDELDEDDDSDDSEEYVCEERGCSLVHSVGWMGSGAGSYPSIFMYCYGPERFAEMRARQEEEETAKKSVEELEDSEDSEDSEDPEVEEVAALMIESKL